MLTIEQIERANALDSEAEVEAVLGPGRFIESAVPVALRKAIVDSHRTQPRPGRKRESGKEHEVGFLALW